MQELSYETLLLAQRLYIYKQIVLATPTLMATLDPRFFAAKNGRVYPTKLLTRTIKTMAYKSQTLQ
jgi:hypothetical protein